MTIMFFTHFYVPLYRTVAILWFTMLCNVYNNIKLTYISFKISLILYDNVYMVLNSTAHKFCIKESKWKGYFKEIKCEANRKANHKDLQN